LAESGLFASVQIARTAAPPPPRLVIDARFARNIVFASYPAIAVFGRANWPWRSLRWRAVFQAEMFANRIGGWEHSKRLFRLGGLQLLASLDTFPELKKSEGGYF